MAVEWSLSCPYLLQSHTSMHLHFTDMCMHEGRWGRWGRRYSLVVSQGMILLLYILYY